MMPSIFFYVTTRDVNWQFDLELSEIVRSVPHSFRFTLVHMISIYLQLITSFIKSIFDF